MVVPKAFLPPGDSGVVTGVFIAREGSSPEQMQAIQDQVDAALLRNPNIMATIEVTGLEPIHCVESGDYFHVSQTGRSAGADPCRKSLI